MQNNTGLSSRPLPAEARALSDPFTTNNYKKDEAFYNGFIEKIRTTWENCSDTSDILNEVYSYPLRLTNGNDVNEFENDAYFTKRGVKIAYQGLEKDGNNSIN